MAAVLLPKPQEASSEILSPPFVIATPEQLRPDVLLAKMLLKTVIVPSFLIAPPPNALLPANVLLVAVAVEPRTTCMAPPLPVALFPEKVLLMTNSMPTLAMPPPSVLVVLLLKVLSRTVSVPLFEIPPPPTDALP